jgi:hypothetical protein
MLLQVKNKYLKEQRINPKRVHDAMTSRDVGMLKKLSEMAQNGDCTLVERPSLLTADDQERPGGDVPDVPEDDLDLCDEEDYGSRNPYFY